MRAATRLRGCCACAVIALCLVGHSVASEFKSVEGDSDDAVAAIIEMHKNKAHGGAGLLNGINLGATSAKDDSDDFVASFGASLMILVWGGRQDNVLRCGRAAQEDSFRRTVQPLPL